MHYLWALIIGCTAVVYAQPFYLPVPQNITVDMGEVEPPPPPPDPVAISVGTTTSSQADATNPRSSLSHTVDADTDLLIVGFVGWTNGNVSCDVSGPDTAYQVNGATWTKSGESGQAMGNIVAGQGDWGDGTHNGVHFYYLKNPTVGAGSISFGSGTDNSDEGGHFLAVNVKGVDTTVGTDGIRGQASNSLSGNGGTDATVDSAATDLILSVLYTYNDEAITWDNAGTTELGPSTNAGGTGWLRSEAGAATSKNTGVSNADYPAMLIISIAEDAGGGGPSGPPVGGMLTLGAGG